ncbi:MAG TPA: hypothetical protein VM265_08085 [Sphingomicrobium sp.]|nr:hypothetical protein [Sphingomicrobium sp.]
MRKIRLGRFQLQELRLCAGEPQRRSAGNPTMRSLAGYGFVESRQHVSARTGMPTVDRLFTATDAGRRYLAAASQ